MTFSPPLQPLLSLMDDPTDHELTTFNEPPNNTMTATDEPPARQLRTLDINEYDPSDSDTSFASPVTMDTSFSSLNDKLTDTPPTSKPISPAMRKYHKHISRSAAKRESVSALPSIKDLKQRWSSGGQVEHRAGSGVGIRPSPLAAPSEEEEHNRSPERKPYKEVQLARVAPAEARREADDLVGQICDLWGVGRGCSSQSTSSPSEPPADVAELLVKTARAVRRVRSLNLAAVDPGQRRVSVPLPRVPARFSTPSRPSGGPGQSMPRIASSSKPTASEEEDKSAPVRRAALDLLGQLRHLEERLRVQSAETSEVPGESSLSIDESTTQVLSSRRASMAESESEDMMWSDEEYNINEAAREAEMARTHAPWEERLVSEARDYRKVAGQEWTDQSEPARSAVQRWVTAVEGIFAESKDKPSDPWVISEGGSEMDRLHAFLVAHLPSEHVHLLPPPSDELLERLSDGFLLIQAYNGSLTTSTRPWGFIPPEDVHDTIEEQAEQGREWTFRRVGNLTCWAAALKIRFNLPIAMPATDISVSPLTMPKDSKASKAASMAALGRRRSLPALQFDPLVVAKRGEGWESMLQTVLTHWITEAAREVKSDSMEGETAARRSEESTEETKSTE